MRTRIGSARINLVHEIEALHRRADRAREEDRARVVHQNVDTAECGDRLLDGDADLVFVTDVDRERQRSSAGGFDLLGGGVDRSRQFRIRLGRFRRDCDIRTVARGTQTDRLTDAAARAGDKECFAAQSCHCVCPRFDS